MLRLFSTPDSLDNPILSDDKQARDGRVQDGKPDIDADIRVPICGSFNPLQIFRDSTRPHLFFWVLDRLHPRNWMWRANIRSNRQVHKLCGLDGVRCPCHWKHGSQSIWTERGTTKHALNIGVACKRPGDLEDRRRLDSDSNILQRSRLPTHPITRRWEYTEQRLPGQNSCDQVCLARINSWAELWLDAGSLVTQARNPMLCQRCLHPFDLEKKVHDHKDVWGSCTRGAAHEKVSGTIKKEIEGNLGRESSSKVRRIGILFPPWNRASVIFWCSDCFQILWKWQIILGSKQWRNQVPRRRNWELRSG